MVWFSPLLGAREVQLVGAERVTQEEVEALVAPELGRPLSRLDADAVRERVEQLPEVASAQVLRVWPSTVEVRVNERVPVAAVPSGTVVLPRRRRRRAGRGGRRGARPGCRSSAPRRSPPATTRCSPLPGCSRRCPPELGSQVTGTTAGTPDSVVLTLASGAQVVWGSPDDSERKVRVLQVLLATPAEVYDVSAPGTPVTR